MTGRIQPTLAVENAGPFVLRDEAPQREATKALAEARHVYVYVNIFSVSDIDTVTQTFRAHFHLRATWLATAGEDNFNPGFMFMNQAEPVEITGEVTAEVPWRQGHNGERVMKWAADCRGVFREQLELATFPFDVQPLSIVLSTRHRAEEVMLAEDMFNGTESILRREFMTEAEFSLFGPFFSVSESRKCLGMNTYALLHITTVAERQVSYYLWNIMVPVFLLTSMGGVCFAVPAEDVADRLSVTLTLVLTSVAFKFMVSQDLPRISYLTLMDAYVLTNFVFLCALTLQNYLAAEVDADGGEFDAISRAVFYYAYLAFCAVVALAIVLFVRRKRARRAQLCRSGTLPRNPKIERQESAASRR